MTSEPIKTDHYPECGTCDHPLILQTMGLLEGSRFKRHKLADCVWLIQSKVRELRYQVENLEEKNEKLERKVLQAQEDIARCRKCGGGIGYCPVCYFVHAFGER